MYSEMLYFLINFANFILINLYIVEIVAIKHSKKLLRKNIWSKNKEKLKKKID